MCLNGGSHLSLFKGGRDTQSEKDRHRQRENEDKLVGGGREKIGDLERKKVWSRGTATHTDKCVHSDGPVWSHLSAEG